MHHGLDFAFATVYDARDRSKFIVIFTLWSLKMKAMIQFSSTYKNINNTVIGKLNTMYGLYQPNFQVTTVSHLIQWVQNIDILFYSSRYFNYGMSWQRTPTICSIMLGMLDVL